MTRVDFTPPQAPAVAALTRQMLEWIGERPRTYGETMEAWRTSCPRMPVWEDAVDNRLVEVVAAPPAGMNGATVRLTITGRRQLMGASSDPAGLERRARPG